MTILAWIKVKTIIPSARILDFYTTERYDNIVFAYSTDTTGKPYFEVFNNNTPESLISSKSLNLNKWYHVATSLKGNLASFYINGQSTGNKTLTKLPKNINRINNFIGKSYGGVLASADYDDIKFYSRALNDEEIINEYLN